MPSERMILCTYEGARFPANEFYNDPVHGMVHFLCPTHEPHTTTGQTIADIGIPGLAFRIKNDANYDIIETSPAMKEKFGVESVDELGEQLQ